MMSCEGRARDFVLPSPRTPLPTRIESPEAGLRPGFRAQRIGPPAAAKLRRAQPAL